MNEGNSKKSRRMLALVDNQAKFIVESSDGDFLRFFKDKDVISKLENSARNNLDISLKASKKKRLLAAKEGAKRAQEAISQAKWIPKSPGERRSLFEKLLSRNDLPRDLTLAFRERKGELSDSEIESALEDLEMLGFFESDSDGKEDDS